jgi:hypothetical protein
MLLLRPLYVLKDTGKIDENGNPIYTHVKTKWGTDAKVGTTAVTKYLLRWISNKETLKDMIKAIEEKKSKAPWVT